MVEGGASVIKSFLATTSQRRSIDTVIVTVAPIFVGADGVDYSENITNTEVGYFFTISTSTENRRNRYRNSNMCAPNCSVGMLLWP